MARSVHRSPVSEKATDGNASCGQLTLNFDPGVHERFATLRQFVAHRSVVVAKLAKEQAADMDMAPSMLSRKLNPAEGDTQRFNCDDLESWLKSSGDAAAVIEYLAAKFMDNDEARRGRMYSRLERILPELMEIVRVGRAAA